MADIEKLVKEVAQLRAEVSAQHTVLAVLLPKLLFNAGILDHGQWGRIMDATASEVGASLEREGLRPEELEAGRAIVEQIRALGQANSDRPDDPPTPLAVIRGGLSEEE